MQRKDVVVRNDSKYLTVVTKAVTYDWMAPELLLDAGCVSDDNHSILKWQRPIVMLV